LLGGHIDVAFNSIGELLGGVFVGWVRIVVGLKPGLVCHSRLLQEGSVLATVFTLFWDNRLRQRRAPKYISDARLRFTLRDCY
jgi:hypothetical protein